MEVIQSVNRTVTVGFSMAWLREQMSKRPKSCRESACNLNNRNFRAKISPAQNKDAEEELRKELSRDAFSKMKVIGQVRGRNEL